MHNMDNMHPLSNSVQIDDQLTVNTYLVFCCWLVTPTHKRLLWCQLLTISGQLVLLLYSIGSLNRQQGQILSCSSSVDSQHCWHKFPGNHGAAVWDQLGPLFKLTGLAINRRTLLKDRIEGYSEDTASNIRHAKIWIVCEVKTHPQIHPQIVC